MVVALCPCGCTSTWGVGGQAVLSPPRRPLLLLLPLPLGSFTNTDPLSWALKTIILSVKKKPSPFLRLTQQNCIFWIIWVLPFILMAFHLLLPFQEQISHLSPSPLLLMSSSVLSFIPFLTFSFCLPAPPHLLFYVSYRAALSQLYSLVD